MSADAIHSPALVYRPDWRGDALETDLDWLELLAPRAAGAAPRELRAYALAYVERYGADVLHLEIEWDPLAAATLDAWRREAFAEVVRLAVGLAPAAARRRDFAEARCMLDLGLAASRRVGDAQRYAYFSMRLGCLLFAQGRHCEGRRIWHEGVRLAESADGVGCSWEPIASFVSVADLLGDQQTARRFTEVALRTRQSDDADSFAAAVFLRGLYARRRGDLDRAYEELSRCVRLVAHETPACGPSPQRQLFAVTAQAELARVRGDDARASANAETAISLAHLFADGYTLAALLIDKTRYACWRGRFPEAYEAYCRLREIARGAGALHIARRASHFLARELADAWGEGAVAAGVRDLSWPLAEGVAHAEPLSARETEVLRGVAAGLSNREIAERLVVTPGTVKKHLEHIYAKLGAHSRTAAVARGRSLGALP